MQRLNKLLAHLGVASRRGADGVIAEGRITVNGSLVTELGRLVDPETDEIRLDGERLAVKRVVYRYLALNKPRGVLTTLKDPQGRPTVAQLLPPDQRVVPVGRLDLMSEGLLILTNDGDLANELTHPRHLHEKEYRVKISGSPRPEALQAWRQGMYLREEEDEDEGAGTRGRRGATASMAPAARQAANSDVAPTAPATPAPPPAAPRRASSEARRSQQARLRKTLPALVKIESSTGSGTWLRFTLTEGRNRQVRRMIEPFKHQVHRLVRVRVGPIRLGHLKSGQWRELTSQEVAALKGDAEALAQVEAAAAPRRAAKPTYKEGWARPKPKAERPGSAKGAGTRDKPHGTTGKAGSAKKGPAEAAGAKPKPRPAADAKDRPGASSKPKPLAGGGKPGAAAKAAPSGAPRSRAAGKRDEGGRAAGAGKAAGKPGPAARPRGAPKPAAARGGGRNDRAGKPGRSAGRGGGR